MTLSDTPCPWAPADDPLYRAYHDEEWGVPEYDSRTLWEKLQLDAFQAGLAWITVLRKRESIREEFEGFDPERIARWSESRIQRALQNPGIIRNELKVRATVTNASVYLAEQDRGIDLSAHLWSFVDGKPLDGRWRSFRDAPAKTDVSIRISKDLKKRGYKFCGPTIVYATMQAVGLVNDHETHCPRYAAVKALAR